VFYKARRANLPKKNKVEMNNGHKSEARRAHISKEREKWTKVRGE
jgi:hypothetical protein